MQSIVKIKLKIDDIPFLPPTATTIATKIAAISHTIGPLFTLYTDATNSPFDSFTIAMTFIPFLHFAPNK